MARRTPTREHDCADCRAECDCGAATANECDLCEKCYDKQFDSEPWEDE